jgi:flavodoxin
MRVLVVYDSWFGNTERIAQALAVSLDDDVVDVRHVNEVHPAHLREADLILIGGPTHRRGASPDMRGLLRRIPPQAWYGAVVGVFDTRYRMPSWRSGSAAREIRRRLRRAGCRIVAAESFFVEGTPDEVADDEVDRAIAWARSTREGLAART